MSASDLDGALRQLGASFQTWLGVSVAAGYGDPTKEWQAARQGCAVFAAGFRSLIDVTGEDRVPFLQGMLSNDVTAVGAGQGILAAHLTASGKVVSDMRVYADEDRFLIDVLAWRREILLTALERYLVADDVEMVLLEGEQPLVGLEGPHAHAVASSVLGTDLQPQAPLTHRMTRFAGQPLRIVHVSEIGGEGFLLCGEASLGGRLMSAVMEAGAVPLGLEMLNTLRIEAGIGWTGFDMDEECLALEAGLENAISFTKGCYLGQEIVERISARGHVNRRLVGLRVAGSAPPPVGSSLQADGRPVGHLTSVTHSPALNQTVALGYIHKNYIMPGSRVEVLGDSMPPITAEVTETPFRNEGSGK